jgi:hypothetical protein
MQRLAIPIQDALTVGTGKDAIVATHLLYKLRRQAEKTSLAGPVLNTNHRQAFTTMEKSHVQIHHWTF